MTDSSDLIADPNYIRGLAVYQDRTADMLSGSASAVSGLAENSSWQHIGVVGQSFTAAVRRAEDAHTRLTTTLHDYSVALAKWLRSAGNAYEDVDDQAARNLDNLT